MVFCESNIPQKESNHIMCITLKSGDSVIVKFVDLPCFGIIKKVKQNHYLIDFLLEDGVGTLIVLKEEAVGLITICT